MNAKLKSLLQQLLRSPQRFPVEAALGLVFFVIAVLSIENKLWSGVSEDILLFFIPLVVFSFWLQRINRWAYYVSFFIFMPLLAVDLKPFLFTFGHLFTYVLAGILLLLGNRRMENRSFVSHAIHIITQMFFGFLISGLLNLALLAIVNSFLYIFGFGHDYKVNMCLALKNVESKTTFKNGEKRRFRFVRIARPCAEKQKRQAAKDIMGKTNDSEGSFVKSRSN